MKLIADFHSSLDDRICQIPEIQQDLPNPLSQIRILQAAPIGVYCPNPLIVKPVAAFEAPPCYLPPSRTSRYRR